LVATGYYLNLLGGSLFWQQRFTLVSGLLLVCLALAILVVIYRSGQLGGYSFWVSLLLFSFLMMVIITLGRSGVFGALQGVAPRYTSFSILAVVSVYAMLVKMALERRRIINIALLVGLCGVILLSAAVSYPRGIREGSKEKAAREKAAFVLSTYESQPDQALTETLNPRASTVRERASVLQELGYNVFSESRVPGSPPPLSELSPVASPTPAGATINGPGISQQGQSVVVPNEDGAYIQMIGWAVDASNENPAGGVYVEVDGEPFPAFYGIERQDVADSFGIASYRYSGFERAIPVSEIGAGPHELSMVVLTGDGKGYHRSGQKASFEVR
jgi:hypothetical protein